MSEPAGYSFDRRQPFLAHRLRERYEFLSLLGRGGAGTVYEVRNLRLDRVEALKVLGDSMEGEAGQRFAHEARVAASLSHPRIVKIHDFGVEEGIHWYAMDLVDGPSLARVLADRGRLEPGLAARALIPILDALDYSHGRGVVHRDLKPANILLNREGRPHLTDFGIAKSPESLLRTRTGLMLGTPAYVAPEQALTSATDPRADLYSVGAMLYHLLSGAFPFPGETALQTVLARLDQDPRPLLELRPGLPPGFARVVGTAMARNPEDRYASAGQMRQALREACEEAGQAWEGPVTGIPLPACTRQPLPALPEGAVPAPGRPRSRSTWLILAGAAALFLAAVVMAIRTRRPPEPEPVPSAAPAAAPVAASLPPRRAPAPPPAAPARPDPPGPAPALPVTYPELLQSVPTESGIACGGQRVILSLRVGGDGAVTDCRVLSDSPPACAQAARKAALQYRFRPALTAGGQPVPATTTLAIEFPESP